MIVSTVAPPCEKKPARSGSGGVCCSSSCYIRSVVVKIPKLPFRYTSCIIVRIVQQVSDKYYFMDVVSFINDLPSRHYSHTFYQRESAVDRS